MSNVEIEKQSFCSKHNLNFKNQLFFASRAQLFSSFLSETSDNDVFALFLEKRHFFETNILKMSFEISVLVIVISLILLII